jgi:SAM-dependent methyltransferase
LPDETIDVVFVNACYPNIVDKEKSFANIVRMMKSGGRLVISHPLGKAFIEKLRARSPFPLDDFPERKDAENFLSFFGLTIIVFEDTMNIYLLIAEKKAKG